MAEKNRIRVELVLTDNDADIIEIMEASGLPRATFFKKIVRDYKELRDSVNSELEDVVKQAVREALAQHQPNLPTAKVEEVIANTNKTRIGFGGKRL